MAGFAKEITKFHYKSLKGIRGKLFCAIFFFPLLFASFFYYIVISVKNLLYKLKILKEKKAEAKVICIGNLTTGGVGKTPVVIEFCRYLSKKYKVSSLSRGYGGKLKGAHIVRDFDKILIDNPELTGDEVNLTAKKSEGYAVTLSKDRAEGANKAAKELGAEIIVMDDGFSNRKIKKDLSLLLFDVDKFIGNGGLLPFGPLREPLCEINRADGVILVDKTGASLSKFIGLEEILRQKFGFKGKIFRAYFGPECFYNIKTKEVIDKAQIQSPFAFCGIGNPDGFYNYILKEIKGFDKSCTKSFDDHFEYEKSDIQNIENLAEKKGAKCLVTTEKDAVKISGLIGEETLPLFVMSLKIEVDVEKILKEFDFKLNSGADV